MINCQKECFPKQKCKKGNPDGPCEEAFRQTQGDDLEPTPKTNLYVGSNGRVNARQVFHHMDMEGLRYEIYKPIPKWKRWILSKIIGYKVL